MDKIAQVINIFMYTLEHYDNQVPLDIHKETYDYIQSLEWQSKYRHLPDATINPSNSKSDLLPYVTKKTVYRATFGHDYESMSNHTPVYNLFNHINDTLFANKFEFNGKPLGMVPKSHFPDKERDDYLFEQEVQGTTSYMEAQPYENVKRTRAPHRDWDDTELTDDKYFTITFIANLTWNPIWHAEMFYYNDAAQDLTLNDSNITQKQCCGVAWNSKFLVNMPGRVVLHDSRLLHSTRATSVLAPELAQSINFRVKLKEGEVYV